MRSTLAACAILVLRSGTADAEQCPRARRVSRTSWSINELPCRLMQYPETLPINVMRSC